MGHKDQRVSWFKNVCWRLARYSEMLLVFIHLQLHKIYNLMLYRYDPFKTGKSQASGFIPFIPKVKPENGVQTFRIPEGYTFSPRSVLFFGLVWSLWYGKTCNDSTLQRHSVFFFCICSHEFRPPSALMDYISPEMFGMIPQILRIRSILWLNQFLLRFSTCFPHFLISAMRFAGLILQDNLFLGSTNPRARQGAELTIERWKSAVKVLCWMRPCRCKEREPW